MELAATMNAEIIGRDNWCNKEEYQRINLLQDISGKCPVGSLYLSGLLPT
jgi:hypothetical protein